MWMEDHYAKEGVCSYYGGSFIVKPNKVVQRILQLIEAGFKLGDRA